MVEEMASIMGRQGKQVVVFTAGDPKETKKRISKRNGGTWPIGVKVKRF